LTLHTAGEPQWDVVALDYETNDLVLFGDHFVDGDTNPKLFKDAMRFAHGGFGEFGRSVGLQSQLRRFQFSSASGDPALMMTLLQLRVKDPGSPVTHPLRISTGMAGINELDMFRVTTSGQTTMFGPLTMWNRLGPAEYNINVGVPGVDTTGFSIRDVTNNRFVLVAQAGGSVRLARAAAGADMATSATDGHVHIPQTVGNPTGVPTPFNATSGGALVFNRSAGRLCVFVNGVGWFGVTLTAL
jgi:hypothetical protein